MNRDELNQAALAEPADAIVGGIKLRPFTWGSMNLTKLLKLSLFTAETPEERAAIPEAEKEFQIAAFAWMQSAPVKEVLRAVHDETWRDVVMEFQFGIRIETFPAILAEIHRVADMLNAAAVDTVAKPKGTGNDEPKPPGN